MSIDETLCQKLKSSYHFKEYGEWLREGVCPDCGKKELWTHAKKPPHCSLWQAK
ncbi:MAG: hypothetical protein Q4B88_06395 [Moraxella sp.]|nr:hypothetical protein [Moraxella sp.]